MMTRSEFLLLCYNGTAEEAADAYETLRRDHELLLHMSSTAAQSQLQFAVDVEKKIKTLETELTESQKTIRLLRSQIRDLNQDLEDAEGRYR